MAEVTLREITPQNFEECIGLRVHDWQEGFIAPNVKSIAASAVFPGIYPWAVYAANTTGLAPSTAPMVGFATYKVSDAVGFILRLMIAKEYQQQGYGRAALLEVIRRLRMIPDVEIIGISHNSKNENVGKLFRSVGFVDWTPSWAQEYEGETYLRLPE